MNRSVITSLISALLMTTAQAQIDNIVPIYPAIPGKKTALPISENPNCKQKPHSWINEGQSYEGFSHSRFFSEANNAEIGFSYLLPATYEIDIDRRFPVVYWLHGNRPGSEFRFGAIAEHLRNLMEEEGALQAIYVFPNGGQISHFDSDQFGSYAETAFLELIRHVDTSFRTIADKSGRAIEGSSQGARGTLRYAFRYPELFCSAIAMAAGFTREKTLRDNNGAENECVQLREEDNVWDIVNAYSKRSDASEFSLMIAAGSHDPSHASNYEFLDYLAQRDIGYEFRMLKDVPHGAVYFYDVEGKKYLNFHQSCFANSTLPALGSIEE